MRHTSLVLAALLFLSPVPALAALGDCGQPVSTGPAPTASDALVILRVAIGAQTCELSVCDVDASCIVSATDALRLLQHAIDARIPIDCDGACGPPTTRTSVTTSSTVSSTTTTLFGTGTWTQVMQIFASNSCTAPTCHPAQGLFSGGLGSLDDFDKGYDQLVNTPVQCFGSTFGARVVPGDPDASFLLSKLSLTPECGSPMPLGSESGALPQVSPQERAIISSWILGGAPKN